MKICTAILSCSAYKIKLRKTALIQYHFFHACSQTHDCCIYFVSFKICTEILEILPGILLLLAIAIFNPVVPVYSVETVMYKNNISCFSKCALCPVNTFIKKKVSASSFSIIPGRVTMMKTFTDLFLVSLEDCGLS